MTLQEAVVRAVTEGPSAVVFQPIVDLREPWQVVGYEALSRFHDPEAIVALADPTVGWRADEGHGGYGPGPVFAMADHMGLTVEIELACLRAALAAWGRRGDLYVGLNVSPTTVLSGRLRRVLAERGAELDGHILLEITEQTKVEDYGPLRAALDELRGVGLPCELTCGLRLRPVKLAIDDFGAGWANLKSVTKLGPEVIKLDIALTRHVVAPTEDGTASRAMVDAVVSLAANLPLVGTKVAAEGIETPEQASLLREMDVDLGQGWYFGRPGPLP